MWRDLWVNEIKANPTGHAKFWAETLADQTNRALKHGIAKAREKFPTWPCKPGEFLALCRDAPLPDELQTLGHDKCAEIANKIAKRMICMNYDQVLQQREIFSLLECKIHQSQSEHWDFAVCAIDKCPHFEVSQSVILTPWFCVKHAEG